MRKTASPPLIEFKGTTVPVVAVALRSLDSTALADAASTLFGDGAFFEGDAALLELAQAGEADSADWPALRRVFETHGLRVIGVRGGSPALRDSAAQAGLPAFAAFERPARAAPPAPVDTAPEPPQAPPPPQTAPGEARAPLTAPAAPPPATLIVDRPLRSGQQVYARGGDLVVLAAVSAGAEVIADGSIHIYAPLRGRALAGARGDHGARIFTTRFEAELVSIAGIYRTFDSGVPGELAGKPVQVQLSGGSADEASASRLELRALSIA